VKIQPEKEILRSWIQQKLTLSVWLKSFIPALSSHELKVAASQSVNLLGSVILRQVHPLKIQD